MDTHSLDEPTPVWSGSVSQEGLPGTAAVGTLGGFGPEELFSL